MRQKLLFDSGWNFLRGDIEYIKPAHQTPTYRHAKAERAVWGPASMDYPERNEGPDGPLVLERWEPVTLPHDFVVTQAPNERFNRNHGYLEGGKGWYRNTFTLSEEDRGARICLYFESVTVHATVYVNGCLMHRNFCGYTSFEVDISDVARFGAENLVAVFVDATDFEGWWYEGGGIVRPVWLIKTAKTAVDLYGVYVHPEKETERVWSVPVETTLRNDTLSPVALAVHTAFVGPDGAIVGETDGEIAVPAKDKAELKQRISVDDPKLWDIETPNLYRARTTVSLGGAIVDEVETRFGFRTAVFDPDKGFFLNGKSVKIKGVCCHQDYGLAGKAVPGRVNRYRVRLLKEMGANGYRTAHYPHAETTMDALDEQGFLVMDETRWFESTPEALRQLEMLVKRDRSRPSVVLWSIGNEEPLHRKDAGRRIAETMRAFIRKLDTTRPVMTAICFSPSTAPVVEASDAIGINYNLDAFDALHEKYPEKPLLSSECCATGTTRGWYLSDAKARGYLYGYDRTFDNFMRSREITWKFLTSREWIAGGYQWAGIEHRGETWWPRLCSQSGALDLFLQKKDAFYQNQSHWTDKPMVHILPHWNLEGREGEEIRVSVYTNCDEVELIVNGSSLGKHPVEPYGHAEWNAVYAPGAVEAVGFRAGREAARERVETTGKPVALRLTLLDEGVRAGRDVAILNCDCVDAEGRHVPDASPLVTFEADGPGAVLATGSDICDHTPLPSHTRKMRAGLCAALVGTSAEPGALHVYARADGLKTAALRIDLLEGPPVPAVQ